MFSHDFKHERVLARHDSPTQRRFRKLCPMPYGVVFLPWAGMTESDMRHHFRLMKELGFTNLKQTMSAPGWPVARILEVALEEGINPFWYGEGGFEEPTPELLRELGIPANTPVDEVLEHPAYLARQREILRKRIHYPKLSAGGVEGQVLQDAGFEKWQAAAGDIQLFNDPVLREDAEPMFKQWCRKTYGTIEKLNAAWNQGEVGICDSPYQSWEDFEADVGFKRHNPREYGKVRDILRFKAEVNCQRIRRTMQLRAQRDPGEPQRAGGEMGLFLPFAWRGTDMEGIAQEMTEHGSFYPSLHLAWHFEEVGYEVTRCIYMQASLAADWFKGGWSATWESTGGPQQFSGGKGWNPKAAEETPGFTVNSGTMGQLLLSYLAGGFRGAGLWCWNFRRAGWEAGEYALLDRQHRPTARAQRAARIARAAKRLRRELWSAVKEPLVGLLVHFDNECIWAAVSQPNRDHFRHYPVQARIGAARALINGNVPWEHVTARDLLEGDLAPRYPAIYLPAQLAISEELLRLLAQYAREGGRVILDAPGGWFDLSGKILPTGPGSAFEQLFGVTLDDFQFANNVAWELEGCQMKGFIMELTPTTARVHERFRHGAPARTENSLGQGTACVLAYDASYACFRPGALAFESRLRDAALNGREVPFRCPDGIVYRLAAPAADHYFFMNDQGPREVAFQVPVGCYSSAEDPETGEPVDLHQPIALEGWGARWLRCLKATG